MVVIRPESYSSYTNLLDLLNHGAKILAIKPEDMRNEINSIGYFHRNTLVYAIENKLDDYFETFISRYCCFDMNKWLTLNDHIIEKFCQIGNVQLLTNLSIELDWYEILINRPDLHNSVNLLNDIPLNQWKNILELGINPISGFNIWTTNYDALLLVENYINFNTFRLHDETILHYVCRSRNSVMIEYVLTNYSNLVDIKNQDGQTPLFIFMSCNCHIKNIKLLSCFLKAGADIFIEDNNGMTIFGMSKMVLAELNIKQN